MLIDAVLLDNFVIIFALIFYFFLFIVYLLRAHELSNIEYKLRIAFSVQLAPFISLWILNLLIGNDSGRLLAGLPIVVYLVYDLWYRLLTRKKPVHHPKKWPIELVVYLIFLMAGSIGLNWYGYIVSKLYDNILVVTFFVMMSSFCYYQYRYGKSMKQTPA